MELITTGLSTDRQGRCALRSPTENLLSILMYNIQPYMTVLLFINLKINAFSHEVFSIMYARYSNIALWFMMYIVCTYNYKVSHSLVLATHIMCMHCTF